jgi:hypothetical protein
MNNFNKKIIFINNLYLFIILYLGIAQIFDYFIPFKLFNLSIFITIIPYFFTLYIYIKSHSYFKSYKLYLFYIFSIVCLITILLRSFFYNEEFFFQLATQRYFLFIPTFILITEQIFKFNIKNNKISSILYIIFFIHTFNSLLYIVGLPAIENVDKLTDEYVEFSRFTGIMGGANVQASFISLIYSILIFSDYKMNLRKFIFLTVFAVIGIAPTVSRGSILILLLIFFYYMYNYFITNIKLYKILIFIIFVLLIIKILSIINNSEFDIFLNSFFDRFNVDGFDTGRSEKNIYFLNTITSNWLHYLLGIPAKLQYFGLIDFDSISDNSFTLLFSNFGIFCGFFFLILIIIFTSTKKMFKSLRLYYFILLLLIIIYNNNAIVWTAWSAYAILGFFFLRNKQILQIKN